jgi:predicted LPLAT superfamily acyltransferase
VSSEWLAKPERGSLILVRLLTWMTLRAGRPIARWFLYPICLYFIVFSRGTRQVSRRYLERALGRPAGWRDVFRHYHAFASTIHDRVYLLSGRHQYFDLQIEGASALDSLIETKRGCILLGSHLGSFEVLRVYGLFEKHLAISVVMHEGAASNLNHVLHDLHPDIRDRIIPPGAADTMLLVKERLDRGELVGILADRLLGGEKAVLCDFFGTPTPFPEGPFLLASLLRVPVILFFGLYRGGRRYLIRFEPFAETIGSEATGRAGRSGDLQPWVQRYVKRLEYHCRLYPYNWFNFYDLSHDVGRAMPGVEPRVWAARHR